MGALQVVTILLRLLLQSRASTSRSGASSGSGANDNATWGASRTHGERLKLGFDVSEPTVSRYWPRRRKPPSQTRRTFLLNHSKDLVSIDFFVVLEHERRRIVQINVIDGSSARCTDGRWLHHRYTRRAA